MADEFRVQLDMGDLVERFGRRIPELTPQRMLDAMRAFMGKLDAQVVKNIETMFGHEHSATRPAHTRLEDSILTEAFLDGDTVVGQIGYDLESTPYAHILDVGGETSPHAINPSLAGILKIPISTLKSGEIFEGATVSEDGIYILDFHVNHPGAHIPGYFYMLSAIADMAQQYSNDLQLAVIDVLVNG
jgi:hypothetical protein